MNTTARELLQNQQLIWIRPTDLVDQALQKMAKNDISALPIIDAPESALPHHAMILQSTSALSFFYADAPTGPIKGFVDVVDLVRMPTHGS